MQPTKKPWGTSTTLHHDDSIEVVRIDVERGGFSSVHYHERKSNLFWVLSGVLCVRWGGLDFLEKQHWLTADGGSLEIPAYVRHQFQAYSPVVAIELYRAAVPGEIVAAGEADLVRLTEQGGIGEIHDNRRS